MRRQITSKNVPKNLYLLQTENAEYCKTYEAKTNTELHSVPALIWEQIDFFCFGKLKHEKLFHNTQKVKTTQAVLVPYSRPILLLTPFKPSSSFCYHPH